MTPLDWGVLGVVAAFWVWVGFLHWKWFHRRRHRMSESRDTPGSPSAVKKGCRCPIADNEGGRGFRPSHRENGGGAAIFWISDNCLLHAPSNVGEILEKLSQDPRNREPQGPPNRVVTERDRELLSQDPYPPEIRAGFARHPLNCPCDWCV